MYEGLRPPELPREITREEAMSAYQPFIEQGITNPDNLDLDNSAVQEANELYYKWQAQEESKVSDDPEFDHQTNLAKTMFYVDAGFNDPGYLRDVLEWLSLDADDVEKQPDNPGRVEMRNQIATAIRKIRLLLENARGDKS